MKSTAPNSQNDEIEVFEAPSMPYGQVRIREQNTSSFSGHRKCSILLTPDQLEEHARECLVLAAKIRNHPGEEKGDPHEKASSSLTPAQGALLSRISQIGLGEFQSRVNRGAEDDVLTALTEMYEAYFAICRAKLGHDHVPIATWETYTMVKQRSALVQDRSARPATDVHCDGQYADFQGARRPCFAQEGCGLAGCPSLPASKEPAPPVVNQGAPMLAAKKIREVIFAVLNERKLHIVKPQHPTMGEVALEAYGFGKACDAVALQGDDLQALLSEIGHRCAESLDEPDER